MMLLTAFIPLTSTSRRMCLAAMAVAGLLATSGNSQAPYRKGAEQYNLGLAHAAGGKTREAIACFQQALQEDPQFTEAWVRLGDQYEQAQQHERALDCYRRATKNAPDNAEAWLALGGYYARRDDWQNVVTIAQEALLHLANTNHEAFRLLRAEALLRTGQTDAAEEELHILRRAGSTNAMAWALDAEILTSKNRWDEAAEACRRAVEGMPTNADMWHNLGFIELKRRRTAEAAYAFARALQCGDRKSDRLIALGITLADQGRLDDSIVVFREVVRAHPESAIGWFNLGEAYRRHGWTQKAVRAYQCALAINPDYQAAQEALAIAQSALEAANTNAIYVIEPTPH
jgi:protein O-GlcNAc transferase